VPAWGSPRARSETKRGNEGAPGAGEVAHVQRHASATAGPSAASAGRTPSAARPRRWTGGARVGAAERPPGEAAARVRTAVPAARRWRPGVAREGEDSGHRRTASKRCPGDQPAEGLGEEPWRGGPWAAPSGGAAHRLDVRREGPWRAWIHAPASRTAPRAGPPPTRSGPAATPAGPAARNGAGRRVCDPGPEERSFESVDQRPDHSTEKRFVVPLTPLKLRVAAPTTAPEPSMVFS